MLRRINSQQFFPVGGEDVIQTYSQSYGCLEISEVSSPWRVWCITLGPLCLWKMEAWQLDHYIERNSRVQLVTEQREMHISFEMSVHKQSKRGIAKSVSSKCGQRVRRAMLCCVCAQACAPVRESAYQGHCAHSIPQIWIHITHLIQYWLQIGRRPVWPVDVRGSSMHANEPTASPILGVRSAELRDHSFDSLTSTCLCCMRNWHLHLAAVCERMRGQRWHQVIKAQCCF